jgi:hypothetical protein
VKKLSEDIKKRKDKILDEMLFDFMHGSMKPIQEKVSNSFRILREYIEIKKEEEDLE